MPNYTDWLKAQGITATGNHVSRIRTIERYYQSLDDHFENGTYQSIIDTCVYSAEDERTNKPTPSRIPINGNIREGLAAYKNALETYRRFLNEHGVQNIDQALELDDEIDFISPSEEKQQRLTLERDMQASLRKNIAALDPNLKIIDDGKERSVNSGRIDITCEDNEGVVIIELKAGTADSRAIAQTLGYIGDIMEKEKGRSVRGILIAHDFDQRTRSAARAVPNLILQKYSIEFKFSITE